MKVNELNRLTMEETEGDKIFRFRFDPSPHVNPNVQLPQRTLIIHAPSSASVSGAVSHLLQKPPKNSFLPRSTHLVLGRDGREIVQMLPFHRGANHASGFNNKSIAIDLQYPGELVEKGHSFHLKSSFAENEYILASGLGNSRYGYWPLYPRDQLDSLLVIARALLDKYDIIDTVVYDEILTAIHPGPAFPIIQFREKLLGINKRSSLLQETSRSVLLFSQPGSAHPVLSAVRIPKGTPVAVINERFDWCLISVVADVDGNPWLMGWVEKRAVRVKTDFTAVVRPDHYLATAEGRQFQEITPHQNGFEPRKTNPEPKFIIMHFTTGTRMESTINHFKDPSSGVSTHLLIGRNGRVVQFLPFDRIAHHSGFSWWEQQSNLNKCSIGIELDNAGLLIRKDGKWQRNKMIIPDKEVKQDVHWKQFTPNNAARFPGWQKFTKVQLDVALNIVRALKERYPSIVEILGHDDVNLRNRYDPGPLFPMPRFRKKMFGRREPEIDEYFINHQTDIYANFEGRLPNPRQKTFAKPLPAKTLVKVIRQAGDFSLVTVIKSRDSQVKGTGWVQTASLDSAKSGGSKGGRKMKGKVVDQRRTTISQPFFKRGENVPTPPLAEGPFAVGTRVRIQEFRGEWTLVVMLDKIRGRGGLEGWVPTEFISRKDE
ncbi:MAG TPA: N-acetylmuramoyl-L-alanine amidase [Anaerolineales bacterium]|nr:N-acetylmuramoyl-L-alanine amidase [Anaerolineales bacterium]